MYILMWDDQFTVLDVMPVLYSRFVRAFRKKRVQTSGQDTVRHVEFGFLVECHKILEQSSEVDTLCQLMHVLLELNVYVARNDDVSRSQHAFLDDIAENAVNLLACPKGECVMIYMLVPSSC